MPYACKKNVQLDVAKQVDAAGFAILVQACRSNNKPDCRSMSFFLPENNRLKIMVYSCSMSSNCVWLQIIFCSRVKETMNEDIH